MRSDICLFADHREPAYIISMLKELGVAVEQRLLGIGDYLLSENVAVERKTASDFWRSMFSGRLFEQAINMVEAYPKSLIVLEGDTNAELKWRSNPRAFWGALLRLEVDMGIPVIPTSNYAQTVDLLYTLAKRLQRKDEEKDRITVHKPKLMTDRDWQVYIVGSLPSVGGELSQRILKKFKSVRSAFQAAPSDLQKVEGIGRAKAERINSLLDLQFNEE